MKKDLMTDLDGSLSQLCQEREPNVHFFKDKDATWFLPSGEAPASHKSSLFKYGLNLALFLIIIECACHRRQRNCPSYNWMTYIMFWSSFSFIFRCYVSETSMRQTAWSSSPINAVLKSLKCWCWCWGSARPASVFVWAVIIIKTCSFYAETN